MHAILLALAAQNPAFSLAWFLLNVCFEIWSADKILSGISKLPKSLQTPQNPSVQASITLSYNHNLSQPICQLKALILGFKLTHQLRYYMQNWQSYCNCKTGSLCLQNRQFTSAKQTVYICKTSSSCLQLIIQ